MNEHQAEPRPKQPPYDDHAEQASLGSMMKSLDAIEDVTEVARVQDFYLPKHRTIYEAILAVTSRGLVADPITLTAELIKRGELDRVGGPGYLHALVESVPTVANAGYYAAIVRERSQYRGLYAALHGALAQVQEGELDVTEIAANVDAAISDVLEAEAGSAAAYVGEGHDAYLDNLEEIQQNGPPKGVKTGFADLDCVTQGLQPGQLIVVAARPAMGKSVLAVDFARNAAGKEKIPTVMFSLEMTEEEIRNRMYAAQGGIALHHLRAEGGMTDEDWTKMGRVTEWVRDVPLTIRDDKSWTVPMIHAECRRLKRSKGLGLVVIDYLQLLESPRQRENRQADVSAMSRGLKLMAKDLGVPVVMLAQLNRGPEQRTDKRPVPSDLRESGSIEQDADMVILIHREDAYEKESPRAGEADLILGKNRHGPTATITVAFQGHYSRFVDMAQS